MVPRFLASLNSTRSSSLQISSYLAQICHQRYNPHQKNLKHIFDRILSPCLNNGGHYVSRADSKAYSVRVPFHEHDEMEISDYFSALGELFVSKVI